MNNLRLLSLSLLILSFRAVSQEKITEKDAPFNRYKRAEVKLAPLKDKLPLAFPVNTIEVLDVRPDTTKLGYIFGGIIGTAYRQFCMPVDAAAGISSFLNSSFNMPQHEPVQKLLYCVRKLWVAAIDTFPNRLRDYADNNGSRLYLQAELFLEKDSICYPVYRFDSVFTYRQRPTIQSVQWIENALVISLSRLKDNNPEKVIKRTSVRKAEINGYYADQQQTAITSVSAPAKGVYLSVADFKNNHPSFNDFEISFDELADIMRVKDKDGSYTIIKKDWGFCDGQKIFIRMGQNYFPLFKAGNTYELLGTTERVSRQNAPSYYVPGNGYAPGYWVDQGSMFSIGKKKDGSLMQLKPFQLDMETGKVY